jgi:hypothetical protein
MKRNWKKVAAAIVPTVAFLLYVNFRRAKKVR